jgi:hypothetical protein
MTLAQRVQRLTSLSFSLWMPFHPPRLLTAKQETTSNANCPQGSKTPRRRERLRRLDRQGREQRVGRHHERGRECRRQGARALLPRLVQQLNEPCLGRADLGVGLRDARLHPGIVAKRAAAVIGNALKIQTEVDPKATQKEIAAKELIIAASRRCIFERSAV